MLPALVLPAVKDNCPSVSCIQHHIIPRIASIVALSDFIIGCPHDHLQTRRIGLSCSRDSPRIDVDQVLLLSAAVDATCQIFSVISLRPLDTSLTGNPIIVRWPDDSEKFSWLLGLATATMDSAGHAPVVDYQETKLVCRRNGITDTCMIDLIRF